MQKIAGTNAVITGGGDGIGRALTLELAKAGANVAVTDIRTDAAEAVAAEAAALGVKSIGLSCDVTDEASIEEMAAQAAAELGPMQIVWANAGLGIGQGFTTARRENLRWMYQVNVDGIIDTVRAFSDSLKEQSGFRAIGVTASMASLTHPDAGQRRPERIGAKLACRWIRWGNGVSTRCGRDSFSLSCLTMKTAGTLWLPGRQKSWQEFGTRSARDSPHGPLSHWLVYENDRLFTWCPLSPRPSQWHKKGGQDGHEIHLIGR